MLVTEGGSTISPSVENSLWKKLWTCRKTDIRMEEYKELRKSLDLREVK
jgi:hypothetical protein